MTLFQVARFSLGIVGQPHCSLLCCTYSAPCSYKVLQPCTPKHSPSEDITAVRETPLLIFLCFENCSALFTGQTCYDTFVVTAYCHINLAWLRNAGSLICTKTKQGSPLSVVDITAIYSYYFQLRQANNQSPLCWPGVFLECIKAINYFLWTLQTSDGSYSHPN